MSVEDKIYEIALSILSGIGPKRAKNLVYHTGSAKAVFKEKLSTLALIDGIGSIRANRLNRKAALLRAEKELKFIAKNKINVHYYKEKNYPAHLRYCDDSPIILYSLGAINFELPSLSIVGTRKATPYGKKLTTSLINDLALLNVQIISGLAHGIDHCAHQQALKSNLPTVAVLGHGLDYIYPAAHKGLAAKMLENGGLITEFLSETPREPSNFPKRNRIVAGISDATVVIESGLKGGSLITANLANDYNRDVFAFPGGINQPYSTGCNSLIKQNKAHLVTSAQDIIEYLGWEKIEKEKVIQTSLFESMSSNENKIYSLLPKNESRHIDYLIDHTQMILEELSLHLFNLEMKGNVVSLPGKRYKRA